MLTLEFSTVSFVYTGTYFQKWSLNYNSTVRFLAVENFQVKIVPFESDSLCFHGHQLWVHFWKWSAVSSLLKVKPSWKDLLFSLITDQSQKMCLGLPIMHCVNYWYLTSTAIDCRKDRDWNWNSFAILRGKFTIMWPSFTVLYIPICWDEPGITSNFNVENMLLQNFENSHFVIELCAVCTLTIVLDTCWVGTAHCNMEECLIILWFKMCREDDFFPDREYSVANYA